MYIYLTSYTEIWKANGAKRKAFKTMKKACNYLFNYGFEYSIDTDLFHNGETEAFIDKIKVE